MNLRYSAAMVRHLLVMSLLFATLPAMVAAQDLRRCIGADGNVTFTDRQCEAGQSERPAQTTAAVHPRSGHIAMAPPPACSATADDLLYNVRNAIDSHDVNLLARSYHWPGLGDTQAESILDRLDALVQRPLVDIQLQFAITPGALESTEPVSDDASAEAGPEADETVYIPAVPRSPHGLKVLQYASPTSTEVIGTRFGLQRHFDCWWIRY